MSEAEPSPEPAAASRLPLEQEQAGDQDSVGVGGRVLSAADLERQLLVGVSHSTSDRNTSPDAPLADDAEWQNLPDDQIKELELILGQLIDYAPSLQASGAVQRQAAGRGGGLCAEDKVYGVTLRDLLKLLVHAVRGRPSGVTTMTCCSVQADAMQQLLSCCLSLALLGPYLLTNDATLPPHCACTS
eukprot:COSAG02_NODE_6586_length_3476_cov_2.239266_5_plen_187_part_00